MENAFIDQNSRQTILLLANDGSLNLLNGRMNPITKALICEADVLSSNTSIGSTIPGGTQGSVLFLDIGGTLAQDNAHFYYKPVQHFLGIGNNNPLATLDVSGTLKIDLGGDSTGDIYFRNSSGFIEALPIGTGSQVLGISAGIPAWVSAGGGGGGVTQILNTDTFLTVSPGGGTGVVTLGIDIANLTSDSTFITDTANSLLADITFLDSVASYLSSDTTFISDFLNTLIADTLLWDSFINSLTSNALFQTNIVNIVNSDPSISIDLTSQVTGVLPVTNGGTGDSSLTAYAPLFGGTTSTGALQSGTVGTAGQVLTSNGVGALPTFQNAGGGGTINPSTQSYLFDEFMGGALKTPTNSGTDYSFQIGELGWYGIGAAQNKTSTDVNHPGILVPGGELWLGDKIFAGTQYPCGYPTLQVPNLTVEYLVKLGATGDATEFGVGNSGGPHMALISSSGNWNGQYFNGTTTVTAASTPATTTGWVKLKIVTDATGANVEFFIDGVSLGSVATSTTPGYSDFPPYMVGTGTTEVDYFLLNQTLTR